MNKGLRQETVEYEQVRGIPMGTRQVEEPLALSVQFPGHAWVHTSRGGRGGDLDIVGWGVGHGTTGKEISPWKQRVLS